jgi:hypothetical protein
MRYNGWLWKSKAHPGWNHVFIFVEPVSINAAKILVRNFWQTDKLPKGFELSPMVHALRWTATDIRSVTNITADGMLTTIAGKVL